MFALKKLIPQSLAWRLVLVLSFGILGSQVLSLAIYSRDRVEANFLLGGQHLVERSANAVNLLEAIAPELRPQLLASLSQPGFNLELSRQAWQPERELRRFGDKRAETIERYLRSLLAVAPGRELRLWLLNSWRHTDELDDYRPRRDWDRRRNRPGHHWADQRLIIAVQLEGGDWLNINNTLQRPVALWSPQATWSLVLSAAILLGLIVWLLRLILQPLRAFATAATRLGQDYRSEPMQLQGPLEVRRAISAFNDMQRRLRHLIENRMQMLAAVSHDLRTPITSLRLRAELIEAAEERRKSLETLDQMEKMIESILTFARAELATEARRKLDLDALLDSICSDQQDLGADVSYQGQAGVQARCAPVALRRALTNLIENAVKYGGCARVRLSADAAAATLTIEDDGPGIPEGKQRAVFLPFVRLNPERESNSGGGLGLSIAQAIIQAHGGSVELANMEPRGLSVVARLPLRGNSD